MFRGKLICADCKTTLGTNTGTKHYKSGLKKYIKLYEDKVTSKISADTFSTLIQKSEAERKEKAARFDTLSAQLKTRNSKEIDITTWIKTIRKYLNLETLYQAVIDEMINHIEIGEKQVIDSKRTQDIKIFYNFVGFIG